MSVKIDENLVQHIAKISRLKILAQEEKQYLDHLKNILKHVDDLQKVNTEGVLPLNNPLRDILGQKDWGKEDQIKPSLPVEDILRNAPDQQLNQFKVDAVIEE